MFENLNPLVMRSCVTLVSFFLFFFFLFFWDIISLRSRVCPQTTDETSGWHSIHSSQPYTTCIQTTEALTYLCHSLTTFYLSACHLLRKVTYQFESEVWRQKGSRGKENDIMIFYLKIQKIILKYHSESTQIFFLKRNTFWSLYSCVHIVFLAPSIVMEVVLRNITVS